MYRINKESTCGQCIIPDRFCKEILDKGIKSDKLVYQRLSDKKLFIFMHDQAECGCMCEVDKISSDGKVDNSIQHAKVCNGQGDK